MVTLHSAQTFIIILLASCIFASGSFEEQLAVQGNAIPLSQNLSYSQVLLNGSPYYLLFSNQTPIAAFSQQGNGIVLLRNKAQILPVLLEYYGVQGAQEQAISALTQGHDSIMQFRDAANGQGVRDCRRITGTDAHSCSTYEECRFACYSVTSYCYPIAIGSGRAFIEEIWKFTNNTRDLSGAISEENAAYSIALSGISSQNLTAYVRSFNSASGIANDLENSVLINWICPSQGFDMVAMSRAGASLSRASLSLRSHEALSAHASEMERFANSSSPAILPELSALSPQESGISSCQIRAQHFITSGNITSIVTTRLDTIGECNLSSFGLRERIPENFTSSVDAARFSIPPISLENREAYWEFDSLQDGQVLVLTYSTDGWVGYSRIKHFNGTTIYLLPQKPLLQNSGLIPINLSMLSDAIEKARAGLENAANANLSQANSGATNETAPTAQQAFVPANAQEILSNPALIIGAGALILIALAAAAYLLFMKNKGGKGL